MSFSSPSKPLYSCPFCKAGGAALRSVVEFFAGKRWGSARARAGVGGLFEGIGVAQDLGFAEGAANKREGHGQPIFGQAGGHDGVGETGGVGEAPAGNRLRPGVVALDRAGRFGGGGGGEWVEFCV